MNSIYDVFLLVQENLIQKQKISENFYEIWLKKIKETDIKMINNTIYIEIETTFAKGVLENNKYDKAIAEGFQEILGFSVDLILLSKDDDDSVPMVYSNTPTNTAQVTDTEDIVTQEYVPPESTQNYGLTQPSTPNTNIPNNSSSDETKTENYNYTFDTFIVGQSNEFAYANCKAITDTSKNVVNANPLFIYGPSGLGKTHLLRAIENAMREGNPEKKIISVSSETFTNDIITAIGNGQTEEFRNKYRVADVLLVDDVQFIAGKESTQIEFFNTFNTLYDSGKQIVLTSDRPPKDIKTLEDRLKTRFESGMMADVNYPDFETRIAIINKKADELGLSLQPNISAFIAENLTTHIRQLGGIVKKLQSYQQLTGKITDLSLAQTVIKEVLSNDQPLPITVEKIIDEVAKSHSVSPDDLRSHKRNANIATARQLAVYIIKETTDMPLSDIGKEFSERDHSTITYLIKQARKKIKSDAKISATIDDIIKNIESK